MYRSVHGHYGHVCRPMYSACVWCRLVAGHPRHCRQYRHRRHYRHVIDIDSIDIVDIGIIEIRDFMDGIDRTEILGFGDNVHSMDMIEILGKGAAQTSWTL